MKRIDTNEGSSVPDMIGNATEAVQRMPMTPEEIQRSLREAGELVIALSAKVPTSVTGSSANRETQELPTRASESSRDLLPASGMVGSLAQRTRSDVLGHVERAENTFEADQVVGYDAGDYNSSFAQNEGDTSLLPKGPAKRERGNLLPSESSDDFFGHDPDTSSSEYFGRDDKGATNVESRWYESQKESMQRLIAEAAEMLQDPMWSGKYDPLYSPETVAAVNAARAAIDELKYPGGMSKNPLKAAKTLKNVFRFVLGNHAEAVEEAEVQLYPLVIARAVKKLSENGGSYSNADLRAAVEATAKKLLPKSFQAGSGWRNILSRELADVVRPEASKANEFFA